MNRMAKFLLRRLVVMAISILIVATVAFGLIGLLPGDPAQAILGSFATPTEIERLRAELGLDLPLHERYFAFMGGLFTGDLGTSFFTGRTVVEEIANRLPATLELVIPSLALAVLLGILLGTIGAYRPRHFSARASNITVSLLQSIPDFLLALFGIYVLFFLWGVVPPPVGRTSIGMGSRKGPTGMVTIDALLRGDFVAFGDAVGHLVLPVLTLGLAYAAYFARTTRSALSEAMRSDQVEFARICGLPERQVLRYGLLQARTPILTYGAMLFGALIGGASIVETIFSWQGIGQWALAAMIKVDVPVVQGFIVLTGAITILIYTILDFLVTLLDPRVKVE